MSNPNATFRGVPLKHLSLVTLVFQNSMLILIMHYSRIMPTVDGVRYHTSTSVFLNEVIKLAISATVALYDIAKNSPPGTPATALVSNLVSTVFAGDSWKLAIPAALYTLQNNLQYVAVSNLDAATFQVTYQLKILTTAIFSVIMLGRVLSVKKWAALALLMSGVAIVQLPQYTPDTPETEAGKAADAKRWLQSLARRAATNEGTGEGEALMNRSVGLMAVLIACALSGLAGVTFEKILKQSSTKQASLWIRNCQLSFWSLFPAFFIGILWVDGQNIAKDGFFAGYNWVVWTAIGFQAAGGIIVALVINYADNIAKNFATSLSIIVSCVASAYFFDFQITMAFAVGTAVVLGATYLYTQPDPPKPTTTHIVPLEGTTTGESHDSAAVPLMTRTRASTDRGSSDQIRPAEKPE